MRTAEVAVSLMMALGALVPGGMAAGEPPPYQVADGNRVDDATLKGWRTWRALACERCHGAQQEGMVGPSLVESMKRLSREEFRQTVLKGRLEKGMPNFEASKVLVENVDGLYAYLKGRSDGAIQPGRLEPLTLTGTSQAAPGAQSGR